MSLYRAQHPGLAEQGLQRDIPEPSITRNTARRYNENRVRHPLNKVRAKSRMFQDQRKQKIHAPQGQGKAGGEKNSQTAE